MTNLILKSSKSLISICRGKKYVILFSVAEMSSGRNVRGRNVRGRNVLAETSVAEMSVAEMSEHQIDHYADCKSTREHNTFIII